MHKRSPISEHPPSVALRIPNINVASLPLVALSVMQPWAWLMVHRFKPIENRKWYTRFRGDFCIHASKTFDAEGLLWVRKTFPLIRMPEHFATGGIVGRGTVTDCVKHSDSPWFGGPFGFVIESASELPLIHMLGQPGFFRIAFQEHTVAPIENVVEKVMKDVNLSLFEEARR